MCRPPVDYENAYREACEQMRLREVGLDDWTNAAIYWAAVRFGQYELKTTPYAQAAKRWATCLNAALECEFVPVPEKMLSLPSVGRSTVTQEVARERMAEIKKTILKMTGCA
jgi:hypothetical protein